MSCADGVLLCLIQIWSHQKDATEGRLLRILVHIRQRFESKQSVNPREAKLGAALFVHGPCFVEVISGVRGSTPEVTSYNSRSGPLGFERGILKYFILHHGCSRFQDEGCSLQHLRVKL